MAILLRRPAAIPAAPRGVVPPCTRTACSCSPAHAAQPRRLDCRASRTSTWHVVRCRDSRDAKSRQMMTRKRGERLQRPYRAGVRWRRLRCGWSGRSGGMRWEPPRCSPQMQTRAERAGAGECVRARPRHPLGTPAVSAMQARALQCWGMPSAVVSARMNPMYRRMSRTLGAVGHCKRRATV